MEKRGGAIVVLDFLSRHIIELLFSLISAGLLYWCKKTWNDKEKYKEIIKENNDRIMAETLGNELDTKLGPISKRIDDVSQQIRDLTDREHLDIDRIENRINAIEESSLDSEKARIIERCEQYLMQGYMTSEQANVLIRLYNNYKCRGGNGQAKAFYDKTIKLPYKD